jgi:hypothetical protein
LERERVIGWTYEREPLAALAFIAIVDGIFEATPQSWGAVLQIIVATGR